MRCRIRFMGIISLIGLCLCLGEGTPGVADPVIPGFYGSGRIPAAVIPPVNALPVPDLEKGITGAALEKVSDTELQVNQSDPKAILNWKSFDIGAKAWVHFNQASTDWAALNRIYDQNPSQIFGRLSADGRVYLINQNGILFGPGSQVNVHALVASSLNIANDDFMNNTLSFDLENYTGQDYADGEVPLEERSVSNHGDIQAGTGGFVFLLGPNVENSGSIDAPVGQVGLAAGSDIDLYYEQDTSATTASTDTSRKVRINAWAGDATNFSGGQLSADMGKVGLYGNIVNQNGAIRSVAAVMRNGNIELIAREKAVLGKDSLTACPVSDSSQTVYESDSFVPGKGIIRIESQDPSDAPLDRIEVSGRIEAPGGDVTLQAGERIYMESGSAIDVGGATAHASASANQVSAQLNSVQLADDYGQKDGILKGADVDIDALSGSAVGNVTGYLKSEQTAAQYSVAGGSITLNAGKDGDIVVKEDAELDFSGGGTWYDAGLFSTTKLLSGHRIYDISAAPQWIEYDKILGAFKTTHRRFGIVETYDGIAYGGPAALAEYRGPYFEGADAGLLELHAGQIVLGGILDGGVTPGPYQTETVDATDSNYDLYALAGLLEPKGGVLQIGTKNAGGSLQSEDAETGEIIIKQDLAPLSNLTAGAAIPDRDSAHTAFADGTGKAIPATYLSADILNQAGLGELKLFTNTRFTLEAGAELNLSPGSLFSVEARRLDIDGSVIVPSGAINLTAMENYTAATEVIDSGDIFGSGQSGQWVENPDYIDLEGMMVLGDQARLSVAGEKIDNTLTPYVGTLSERQGRLTGGGISLLDTTAQNFLENRVGLIVSSGARLDVSGGYQIDANGDITGGDAGTIQIQAADMTLDGQLKSYALRQYAGGEIDILARKLTLVPGSAALNSDGQGMVLADNRFAGTGFEKIVLRSYEDLTVNSGVALTPSTVKWATPVSGVQAAALAGLMANGAAANPVKTATITVSADELSDSRLELHASESFSSVRQTDRVDIVQNPQSQVTIAAGATVRAAPEGDIGISGTHVQVAGDVSAPAGSIEVTGGDVMVTIDGSLDASGYNRPVMDSYVNGLPTAYEALPGGEIVLDAGEITLAAGSSVDVSGSAPIVQYAVDAVNGIAYPIPVSGAPGGITLSYKDTLSIASQDTLRGQSRLSGIPGGSLTISKTDPLQGMDLTAGGISDGTDHILLNLDAVLGKDSPSGFDALTLKSLVSLNFQTGVTLQTDQSLILDAPNIHLADNAVVKVQSPWVTLQNTYFPDEDTEALVAGSTAAFNVTATSSHGDGGWVDIKGDVRIGGLGQDGPGVVILADRDIRLSDRYYTAVTGGWFGWRGRLTSPGDLSLTAGRIYPTTQSDFTLAAEGTITTAYPDTLMDEGPVYSAGGRIALVADKINHQGALVAPMGEIELAADTDAGRVYLAPGSRLSTKGETRVKYGTFDADGIDWFYADKAVGDQVPDTEMTEAPERGIKIAGADVIVREGAEIDASGGGAVFGYKFLPGIEGSSNPLARTGQYVILADNSIQLPGEAVYLEGIEGLPAGTYSLLPQEYAFMPGALVIRDLGVDVNPAAGDITQEGYAIATGFAAVMGTDARSPVPHRYSVRSADDVLAEGNFTTQSIVSGDGGDITIDGSTTLINGTIISSALPASGDYAGGVEGLLALSGVDILVGGETEQVNIGFEDDIAENLRNTLSVGGDTFADTELGEIRLGNITTTKTITLAPGSRLSANNVTLSAKESIRMESGSEIDAKGQGGVARLTAKDPDQALDNAQISLSPGSVVHASDRVVLDAHKMDIQGTLAVDNSTVKFAGDTIYMVDDAYTGDLGALDGTVVTESVWQSIQGVDNIGLESGSDVVFLGDGLFTAPGEIAIDAQSIVSDGTLDEAVTLTANRFRIQNSSAAADASPASGEGTLRFDADTDIAIGNGDIDFDGFDDIHFDAARDITFVGQGSLSSGGADIRLTAVRVDTTYHQTPAPMPEYSFEPDLWTYQMADFRIDAGDGGIDITTPQGNGTGDIQRTPGGRLTLSAAGIGIDAPVDVYAGALTATAREQGIVLGGAAIIRADGTPDAPGGSVLLTAGNGGSVGIDTDAEIDVSAGVQGEAGVLGIFAPGGTVILGGTLKASGGAPGHGGTFRLDADQLPDFADVAAAVKNGGFDREVAVRARSGNLIINDDMTAHAVELTVDDGTLALNGAIANTADSEGGRVELNAGNDLTLGAGGFIDAATTADDGDGGFVYLNTTNGTLIMETGADIDVSGTGQGQDGSVIFRTSRNGAGINMDLNGTVKGAAEVLAEAVEVYDIQDYVSLSAALTAALGEADTYINTAAIDIGGLTFSDRSGQSLSADSFHLTPGIEIQSDTFLVLGQDTDLYTLAADLPDGGLTLRAAGDLTFNGSLTDNPAAVNTVPDLSDTDSWNLRLVAGADLGGANIMAVQASPDAGTLTVVDQKQVYTESGDLWFAAAEDVHLGRIPNVGSVGLETQPRLATMGTYDGDIRGTVKGDLTLSGAVIQSAVGDIGLDMGGNVILNAVTIGSTVYGSAIRTLGRAPDAGLQKGYWDYAGGGDIDLHVVGDVQGYLNPKAWDYAYKLLDPQTGHPLKDTNGNDIWVWAANYNGLSATKGIATLGGGNLRIQTGGSFFGQAGTFGTGDLSLYTGGNLDGIFLVSAGDGRLATMGSFGTKAGYDNQPLEIMDADMRLSAQGHIELGTAWNPTLYLRGLLLSSSAATSGSWNMSYAYEIMTPEARNSAVRLAATEGDIVLTGDTLSLQAFQNIDQSEYNVCRILPPEVGMTAGGGIYFQNSPFFLAPSPTGNLTLSAGESIYGKYQENDSPRYALIQMPEVDPALVYGLQIPEVAGNNVKAYLYEVITNQYQYAPDTPLHGDDPEAVSITAEADLDYLKLKLCKKAEVSAGGDIVDLGYEGQNVNAGDVSRITAGGDLRYTTEAGTQTDKNKVIKHGGAGFLMVGGKDGIDLGSGDGIQAVGNKINPNLPDQGSTLAVIAGYDADKDEADIRDFFDALKETGTAYSEKLSEGDRDGADAIVAEAREAFIDHFLTDADGASASGEAKTAQSADAGDDGDGRLNMVLSQISTVGKDSDILILARGDMNIGRSTFGRDEERNTGIYTAGGGDIFTYGGGDINVNESRMMTFFGGDILAWSEGDINAGRGSKTQVSITPAKAVKTESGDYKIEFSPPALGSGARTATFDPDGPEGPEEAPEPGDIYFFAPNGEIDAGEAGISGKRVILGAVSVVNVQNISFSQGSVGVPSTSESTASIGALSGGGALSEAGKLADAGAAMEAANKQFADDAKEMEKTFMPTWLRVEFMGFDTEDRGWSKDDEE